MNQQIVNARYIAWNGQETAVELRICEAAGCGFYASALATLGCGKTKATKHEAVMSLLLSHGTGVIDTGIPPTPHYVKEHPDFPEMPEVDDLKARGFTDQSWHNDTCPGFEFKLDGADVLKVWIEHPNPDYRESGQARFYVERFNADEGNYGEDVRYIGNDWATVLATIEAARGEK